MAIPKGLSPELIGKVVTVQVFYREEPGSDTLDHESMQKHVGTLEMYYHDQNGFLFKLVGGALETVSHTDQYVEFHPYTKVNKYQFG